MTDANISSVFPAQGYCYIFFVLLNVYRYYYFIKRNKFQKWREGFLTHLNELRTLENECSKLTEPKPQAEGVDEVKENAKDIGKSTQDFPSLFHYRFTQCLNYSFTVNRWNKLFKNSDETLGLMESNFGAMGDFNNRAMQLKEWLNDKNQMVKMIGPNNCDKNALNTQLQQLDVRALELY